MNPSKEWECSKCPKKFKTNKNLTMHLDLHDYGAKVKCEVWGKVSQNGPALNAHLARFHANRERPSCDTCHRVFSSFSYLRRHMDTTHSTKERPRLPCTFPGCEKTYLNKGDVAKHVKLEHAQNLVRFPCTLCGKDFKTRGELKQHIPTHTTEKPYVCATCGRGFAHNGVMKRHEMTHLEKSTRHVSKCHVCPQTFLSRITLQQHIRVVHENQRNYPCLFCDQRFSKSSNLKGHVEAKHAAKEERIHSCDKCEYKTHSKPYLAAHRIRHNATKHGCYFCGKRCITLMELVSHFRVHTLEQ
ncbi:zinc finger protein 135-like [Folsomia candida]|uniref:zinc finger protein 135-like n=1 Tax=Folsomia candida TaxID=158441 RepID=UPI001604D0DD|nr:zinc finger protein 135-like [Folsomia candida]